MKKKYYVNENEQTNGDHEVHAEGCSHMPILSNRKYLGEFYNCWEAVASAKKDFIQVNGCYYCSKECHTQ